jgi:hypothetical protein
VNSSVSSNAGFACEAGFRVFSFFTCESSETGEPSLYGFTCFTCESSKPSGPSLYGFTRFTCKYSKTSEHSFYGVSTAGRSNSKIPHANPSLTFVFHISLRFVLCYERKTLGLRT